MTVAIDGPAGVGKSTVARACAESLGFLYLNSGNLYRAITYAHLKSGRDPEDFEALLRTAETVDLDFADGRIRIDGEDATDGLHTDDVDRWVAQHSAVVEIRRIVNRKLRAITRGRDVIVEGRDITTVVFPDAEVKVYLDASLDVRARRRFDQGTSAMSLDELRDNIAMRDRIDGGKVEGSLKIAADACYIDTSCLTIEGVCERVARLIRNSKNA